jgi:fibronectin-binding autotransporter adhesin
VYTYAPANSTTDLWSLGTDWSSVPVSDVTTQLTFVSNNSTTLSNGLVNTNTNDIAGAFTLNTLNLQGTSVNGTTATITVNSSSTSGYLNFLNNGALATAINLNAIATNASLTYNINSNIALVSPTVVQGNGTATFNFNGIISGTGNLTKNGTSTLVLAGDNTYSGAVTVNSGQIQLNDGNALQNSTVSIGIANGITFQTGVGAFTLGGLSGARGLALMDLNSNAVTLLVGNNNGNSTYSGQLNGNGNLTKIGNGILTLTGSSTFTGDTRIASGTLLLSGILGINALHYSTLDMNENDNGTLAFFNFSSSDAIIGGLKGSRPLTIHKSNFYVGLNNQNTCYSGVLSGDATLVKQGYGTLTLTNANVYAGSTHVYSGALNIGDGRGLPASSKLCFAGYGTDTPVVESSADIVGQVGPKVFWYDSGGFAATGAPIRVRLTNARGGQNLAWNSMYFVPTGSSLVLNSPTADNVVDFQNPIDLNGADRTIYVADNASGNTDRAILSGALTGLGGFIKEGPGLLILSGNNTYSGSTCIKGGTLAWGADNTIPNGSPVVLGGGTLSTNGYCQSNPLGVLTLDGNSVIELNEAGNCVLKFADSREASWSGILNISDWNGDWNGGGMDEIFVGSTSFALRADQLGSIFFVNPSGHSGIFQATILSTGEVVPVPEPTMYVLLISGVLLLIGAFVQQRRHSEGM